MAQRVRIGFQFPVVIVLLIIFMVAAVRVLIGQPRYVKWRVTDAGGKSRIEQQTLNIIDDYGPRFLNQDQDGTNTINITVNSDTDTVNATVEYTMDNG